MNQPNQKKAVIFEISASALETLIALGQEQGIDRDEAVENAIFTEAFLMHKRSQGVKILLFSELEGAREVKFLRDPEHIKNAKEKKKVKVRSWFNFWKNDNND